jgi:Rrf2 family protein
MLKTESEQALRALAALAASDRSLSLVELARRASAPAPMLAKVLARLGHLGLVAGRRGPKGGYRLARPAAKIALGDVVLPLEGLRFANACLFGPSECSSTEPCPLHQIWEPLRDRLIAFLERSSLADLASADVAAPKAAAETSRRAAGARRERGARAAAGGRGAE